MDYTLFLKFLKTFLTLCILFLLRRYSFSNCLQQASQNSNIVNVKYLFIDGKTLNAAAKINLIKPVIFPIKLLVLLL